MPATKAKKSSSTRRTVKDSSLPSVSVSPDRAEPPVAPPVDVKAAMKAASESTVVVTQVRLEREQSHLKVDNETLHCLDVLYPILHPDEIVRHDLDSHSHKLARWRLRHGS